MNSDSFSYPNQPFQSPDFPQLIHAMKQKLYQTIISLTSDLPLKQLTFSPQLSEFKHARIKQIIHQTFNLSSLLQQSTHELTRYKTRCYNLELEIQEKNREQLNALEEVQKRFTEYKYTLEVERNNLNSVYGKEGRREQRELERVIERLEEEVGKYQQMMRVMQDDMVRIKGEWEKRCREVEMEGEQRERYLVEEVRREAQGRLDGWLEEMEKEGKMVVREDSGRLEEVKKECRAEIKRVKEGYERVIEELEGKISQSRNKEKREKDEVEHYIRKLNEIKLDNEDKSQKMLKENTLLKQQINILTAQHEQNLLKSTLTSQKLTSQSDGLLLQLNTTSQLLSSKQHQISLLKQNLLQSETTINDLKSNKYHLTSELSSQNSKNIELQSRLIRTTESLKQSKQKLRSSLLKFQGVKLACIRMKNHYNMERDQIKYELEGYQRRMFSMGEEIGRYLYVQLEKCEVKYTGKLNSLMYQFDVNQKNQNLALEQAVNDNQYLKGQLKEYEEAFEERMEEMERERKKMREDMEEEVEGLRRTVMKMLREIGSDKGDKWERIKQQIQKKNKHITRLEDDRRELLLSNNEFKSRIQSLQTQINDSLKQNKHTQKQLRQTKADLMVKNTMIQQYSKQTRQKQNIRSNNNRQQKQKQMEEIRVMLAKTYEAVGSEMPEKHRRKH